MLNVKSLAVTPPVTRETVPAVPAKIASSFVPPRAGQTTSVVPFHQFAVVLTFQVPVPPVPPVPQVRDCAEADDRIAKVPAAAIAMEESRVVRSRVFMVGLFVVWVVLLSVVARCKISKSPSLSTWPFGPLQP